MRVKKVKIGDYVQFFQTGMNPLGEFVQWSNWGRVTCIVRQRRYSRVVYYGITGNFGVSGNIHSSQILRVDKRRFRKIKKERG